MLHTGWKMWAGTLTTVVMLSSCGSFQPDPESASTYVQRAHTSSEGLLRVRVSVLSADESQLMFDADLYGKGIQPVWIEVENRGEARAWYLPVGTDSEYFVPHEVAWIFRGGLSDAARTDMEAYLRDSAMSRLIPAGETVSGFVFTHLTSGTKGVNVDLVGDDLGASAFTFYIDVPGLRADHRDIDPDQLYKAGEIRKVATIPELKVALDELPCCSTEPTKNIPDFVLNLVVLGDVKTFHHALIKGRWEEAPVSQGRHSDADEDYEKYFRGEPVEPMYVYDRIQDAVFRKTRPSVGESNQVNLWLTPIRYNDLQVWVAQTARTLTPRGGAGSSLLTEPNLDEARFFFMQNLLYSGSLAGYGYIDGIDPVSFEDYEAATDGTEYFTDGERAVIWLSDEPVTYNDVEYVGWAD
jgi:hypothetical protein